MIVQHPDQQVQTASQASDEVDVGASMDTNKNNPRFLFNTVAKLTKCFRSTDPFFP